jgi:hypothetical protein
MLGSVISLTSAAPLMRTLLGVVRGDKRFRLGCVLAQHGDTSRGRWGGRVRTSGAERCGGRDDIARLVFCTLRGGSKLSLLVMGSLRMRPMYVLRRNLWPQAYDAFAPPKTRTT